VILNINNIDRLRWCLFGKWFAREARGPRLVILDKVLYAPQGEDCPVAHTLVDAYLLDKATNVLEVDGVGPELQVIVSNEAFGVVIPRAYLKCEWSVRRADL